MRFYKYGIWLTLRFLRTFIFHRSPHLSANSSSVLDATESNASCFWKMQIISELWEGSAFDVTVPGADRVFCRLFNNGMHIWQNIKMQVFVHTMLTIPVERFPEKYLQCWLQISSTYVWFESQAWIINYCIIIVKLRLVWQGHCNDLERQCEG